MTTVLAPYLKQRFVDANGAALYLGTVSTFAAGTNTPIVTYKDSAGIATNTNPITLNPRGECDIWLQPNVAYKITVADQLGNLIWTVDNIVNSQLITLYGGVDSGSANAYLLNFIANFTAYADGIIIYWTPANTNTGPSTININGLGIINIVNPDGTALLAGEIVANQPAQILIKGGAAQLITAATVLYGSFAPSSWTGFGVAPAGNVLYRKTGSIATLVFPPTTGTSNSTILVMNGLPAILRPGISSSVTAPIVGLVDNSAGIAGGMATINTGSATVQFYKDGAFTGWTAAGAKGFNLGSLPTLTYPI